MDDVKTLRKIRQQISNWLVRDLEFTLELSHMLHAKENSATIAS